MNYNSVSPHLKLPFSVVRGSVLQRKEKCSNYVERLYRDLYPKFIHGKVQIEDVQKSVDKVLGLKGKVHVIQYEQSDYCGGQDVLISDYTGKISGITLELDTNKKFLNFPDLVTIVHEFQHVADMFFHPKYMARYQRMSMGGLYTKKYDKMYGELFDSRVRYKGQRDKRKILRRIENKFRKFLKKLSPAVRMDYIQDTRFFVLSEDAAIKAQLKYARLLNKKHHPIDQQDLVDEGKKFLYREKLKIIDRVAANTLIEERLRIKKAKRVRKNKNTKRK